MSPVGQARHENMTFLSSHCEVNDIVFNFQRKLGPAESHPVSEAMILSDNRLNRVVLTDRGRVRLSRAHRVNHTRLHNVKPFRRRIEVLSGIVEQSNPHAFERHWLGIEVGGCDNDDRDNAPPNKRFWMGMHAASEESEKV